MNILPQIKLGPPGTGKTTKLLTIVDDYLLKGYNPSEICFVTFSKKASTEAMTRACEKFNLQPDDLPYFKTLHSLAFKELAMDRRQVMAFIDYLDIARLLGISISNRTRSDDGTFAGFEKGDRLIFTENLSRIRCITLEEQWAEFPDEDLNLAELQQVRETLLEYKRLNVKMDFTDMIHRFNEDRRVLPIKVLIVDEAQDLSQVQWRMVWKLAEDVEAFYIAGDDDQAIYRWAGADIKTWVEHPGEVEVLDRSYRVPKTIADVANDIIIKVGQRREKIWHPREELGTVNHVRGVEMLDMSQGTWLCLVRNAYLMKHFEEHCTRQGLLFTSPAGNIRAPSWEAVIIWERLRAGKEQMFQDVVKVYDFMTVKVGVKFGFKGKFKDHAKFHPRDLISLDMLIADWGLMVNTIWHEALDRLPAEDREYFIAALRNGEKPTREPRIKISTIHAAKGGEADNVAIITDMAQRTHREAEMNPDDEARVWYVAVTRAKKNLFIVQAQTMRHFDL